MSQENVERTRQALDAFQRRRGRVSGIEVSRKIAQVCTVRDGQVIKIVGFDNRAQALEAAGLSEQDAHADS
jgi:ketosteroid isomerase-like protein